MVRPGTASRGLLSAAGLLPAALAWLLVGPQSLEAGLPQPAILRPFREGDLRYQPGTHPVDVRVRHGTAQREGRSLLFQSFQPLPQVQQGCTREAGTDLAGVAKVLAVVAVVADQQGPQADARSLG